MESKWKEKLEKQRSRKRKQDELHAALDSIASSDLSEVCNLQDERLVDVILRCKFNPDALITISYLATQLPPTLPSSLTEGLIDEVVTNAPLHISTTEANTLYAIFHRFPALFLCRQHKAPPPNLLTNCKTPLFRVLVPPCSSCLQCDGSLSLSSTPSKVTLFSLEDLIPGIKIRLKCQRCNIRYGYAFYGNKTNYYRFYDTPRPFVEATGVNYFHRKLCLSQIFLALVILL